jgi:hypothetical protein
MYMNEPAVRAVMRLIDSTPTLEEVIILDSCKMGKRAWSGLEQLLMRKHLTTTNQLPTFSQKSPSKPLARLGRFDIRCVYVCVCTCVLACVDLCVWEDVYMYVCMCVCFCL